MDWTLDRERLRKYRLTAGMTQSDVAAHCGVSLRSYKRWESGESRPYVYNLKRLARAFGLPDHAPLVVSSPAGDGNERLAYEHKRNYRLVCFSLDGALLTGPDFEFSWRRIWQFLGDGEKRQEALLKKYLRREISYAQLGRANCAAFRAKGLRRDHLPALARGIRLRPGARQTLAKLKRDGFRLCIVSGGVDIFLYHFLPEADELFDRIYINEMKFDAAGAVERIATTDFDFEGKARAVAALCADYGIAVADAVFVGNSFNDEHVAAIGAKTVTFTDAAQNVRVKFDRVIDAENCTEILDILYHH